jgi:sugar O-acyltransferase (sialic acid O-acetyltransferase NeuD family)
MNDQASAIGILGGGGQADEAESFFTNGTVLFRAVDKEYIHDDLIDISEPTTRQLTTPVVAAVGAPELRKTLIEKWKGGEYATIVSEYAYVASSAIIGPGSIIAPHAALTTNVQVGEHSLINLAATISHNTILGRFVTISPGANIAGNVVLGDGVFVGIGAIISNGVRIASGVVVGAGTVVLKNIDEENSVYIGVPAKKLSQNNGWLNEL